MPDTIADAAVALSLMIEALRLLDGPNNARAADHLRMAIAALSPNPTEDDRPAEPSKA